MRYRFLLMLCFTEILTKSERNELHGDGIITRNARFDWRIWARAKTRL
jgi:hypothetical protein